MVHTRIAEGQEGVGRDAGAAHKGAAWSGPTIASPLRALQCPTTASLPERIGPASKRESSSASDLGYQMPSLFGINLSLLSFLFLNRSIITKKIVFRLTDDIIRGLRRINFLYTDVFINSGINRNMMYQTKITFCYISDTIHGQRRS